MPEVLTEIAGYIAVTILKQPQRKIEAEEALISSGLIDSFSLVDLALFVEDVFGARIEDTELNKEHFDTLAQLSELVAARRTK